MIFETEPMDEARLNQLPALSLAYMGDAVYEMLVRAHMMRKGAARASSLHRTAVGFVSADAQAGAAKHILPCLTEAEAEVYRRGRNAKPHTIPRNTTHGAYAHATALEALFGWLYLGGRTGRILELWEMVLIYFHENNR